MPPAGAANLVRKLTSVSRLSDEEQRVLRDLPMTVTQLRPDQDIVREGDKPSRSCLLLEGFATTYKITNDGRRQIMAFHIPGTVPDLQSMLLAVLDASIDTIVPCTVGFIEHRSLLAICERYPGIMQALWRETLVDSAIFREWMLGLGQRDAYTRMAHFFCEHHLRMRSIGRCKDGECDLPVSQSLLGEILGISTVHVNRTLQELRRDGVVGFGAGRLLVPDLTLLLERSGLQPAYLQLKEPEAALA